MSYVSTDATLGRSASTITYSLSSLSLTIYRYLSLALLFVVAVAAAPSMLLIAPLTIALLLLPDDTTPVSDKQWEAWWESLLIANHGELPGCMLPPASWSSVVGPASTSSNRECEGSGSKQAWRSEGGC